MADKFDRFTERAKHVLTLAQEEAQRFNHNYIGTEHLLLGLVREGNGVGARVLIGLGVELLKVRQAVEYIIGRGEGLAAGEIGLTPRAKKVVELAIGEARRLNHHYVGTEHLLLGLVREGEGIAAGVLESMGVNLDTVRERVMQVVGWSVAQPIAERKTRYRRLTRVLPVAQARVADGIELLFLAVEQYEDGFILNFRLQPAAFSQPEPEPSGFHLADLTATIVLDVTDDQGKSSSIVFHRSSRGGSWQHWLSYALTPALDPAARALRVVATEQRPPRLMAREPASQPARLWEFTVALPPLD